MEFHRVLCWVREFNACTPNLLVISFSGMDCLTIPMQMTRSCIWQWIIPAMIGGMVKRVLNCVSLKLGSGWIRICWSWMMTKQSSLCLHQNINRIYITIGDTVVDCSSQVKDLGVIFDRLLSPRQHVSYTSRACRFHPRNISRIRKYILQYISNVLYGLPKCTVSGL